MFLGLVVQAYKWPGPPGTRSGPLSPQWSETLCEWCPAVGILDPRPCFLWSLAQQEPEKNADLITEHQNAIDKKLEYLQSIFGKFYRIT